MFAIMMFNVAFPFVSYNNDGGVVPGRGAVWDARRDCRGRDRILRGWDMVAGIIDVVVPEPPIDGAWNLSTDLYPVEQRLPVWNRLMGMLSIPMPRIGGASGLFHGAVAGVVSPQGIEFSTLASTPQTISGCCPIKTDAVWLVLIIEGHALLESRNSSVLLEAGDIVFGPTGRYASLEMETDFRLLHAKIPARALHPSLLNPHNLSIGHLSRHDSVCHVFGGMLGALADMLHRLRPEQMHAVDMAMSEFLVAGVAMMRPDSNTIARRRSVEFRRLCDAIDRDLSDPNLTLRKLAASLKASSRYVQKLFENVGTSFSHYLRERRLENCSVELRDPACANLSISDICFRWGFNDAAHFSRSFRDQFGMSPREFRRMATAVPLRQ